MPTSGEVKHKVAALALLCAAFLFLGVREALALTWGDLSVTSWYGGGYIVEEGMTAGSWPSAGSLTVDHVTAVMKGSEACSGDFKAIIAITGNSYSSDNTTVSLTTDPQEVVFNFPQTIQVADITSISLGVPVPNTTSHPCYHNEGAGHWHSEWGYSTANTFAGGHIYPYGLGSGDAAFQVDSEAAEIPLVTTITNPAEGALVDQNDLNSASGPYQIFTAVSSLDSDDNPDVTGGVIFELYENDQATLICRFGQDNLSIIESGGHNYYGASTHLNEFTYCPPVALSSEGESYYVKAFFVLNGQMGDFSEWVSFKAVPFGYVPPMTCEEAAGWFNFCFLENLANFLFVPNQASLDWLLASMGIKCPDGTHNCGLGAKFPFNIIDGTMNGFFDALNTTAYDFGSASGGNPFENNAPNAAWFAEKFKAFYGDWAGPAVVAVVWFTTIAATINAGFILFNLGNGPFVVNAEADHGGPLTARGELIHFEPDDPADREDFEQDLFEDDFMRPYDG